MKKTFVFSLKKCYIVSASVFVVLADAPMLRNMRKATVSGKCFCSNDRCFCEEPQNETEPCNFRFRPSALSNTNAKRSVYGKVTVACSRGPEKGRR